MAPIKSSSGVREKKRWTRGGSRGRQSFQKHSIATLPEVPRPSMRNSDRREKESNRPFMKNVKGDERMMNCWEYMKCGREPGGINAGSHGGCRASTNRLLDKVHGGLNAGRSCWAIAGSLSRFDITGTFAKQHKDCRSCQFFQLVKEEEGKDFWPLALLYAMLGYPRKWQKEGEATAPSQNRKDTALDLLNSRQGF